MTETINLILEFFYILIGLLLGIIFAAGNYIPFLISGVLLTIMGALTLFKQVKVGKTATITEEEGQAGAQRIGSWIFFPAVALAAVAVGISYTPLGGQVGIGIASVVALLVAVFLTKASPKTVLDDTDRMIQAVGTVGILPQLLAALGVVFTVAGVGDVISNAISGFIPEGNRFIGVVAYCVGMALFTMIMGNAFAAFTVITAGIGIPFVIAQGGDPVIAGTLAMTAGFCGTLVTPMAANFNALPVALLEMKDPNGVIKAQAPTAGILLVIHIALMYFLAF